ncbi:hypothetical protein ACFQFQ_31185 [Sulfitobacter porphyrae]|uniref:Uncharacterized protein n=1 Tax=Sulfitobacter porphyrae TaxID=1246864 RepID=A0ABW2BBZ3_9RHOB
MEGSKHRVARSGQPVCDGFVTGTGLLELGLGPFQLLADFVEDREDLRPPLNGGIGEGARRSGSCRVPFELMHGHERLGRLLEEDGGQGGARVPSARGAKTLEPLDLGGVVEEKKP